MSNGVEAVLALIGTGGHSWIIFDRLHHVLPNAVKLPTDPTQCADHRRAPEPFGDQSCHGRTLLIGLAVRERNEDRLSGMALIHVIAVAFGNAVATT
jgi:hypothetical protein